MNQNSTTKTAKGNGMRGSLEDMYTASLLSNTNAMVVCQPGYGKTEMSFGIAKHVLHGSNPSDGLIFVELDPSTPPDVVRGYRDPAALLAGNGMKMVYDGTPYDPNAKIVILDELWRSNDVVFDALIHTTNDIRRGASRPCFWGTSNFVVKSPRTEALRDRFAMWYYYTPDPLNVRNIICSGDLLDWEYNTPTWNDIMEVRNMEMTDKALNAIAEQIEMLAGNVAGTFNVNPRRVKQWRDILFRYSAYLHGTNDFDTIPAKALQALRFAYPASDAEEYTRWGQAVMSIIDALGTALTAIRAEAYKRWKQVVQASSSDKSALHAQLGKMLADAEIQLSAFGQDDPAVIDALTEMNTWYRKAVRGESF